MQQEPPPPPPLAVASSHSMPVSRRNSFSRNTSATIDQFRSALNEARDGGPSPASSPRKTVSYLQPISSNPSSPARHPTLDLNYDFAQRSSSQTTATVSAAAAAIANVNVDDSDDDDDDGVREIDFSVDSPVYSDAGSSSSSSPPPGAHAYKDRHGGAAHSSGSNASASSKARDPLTLRNIQLAEHTRQKDKHPPAVFDQLYALAESKDKWIRRAQNAKQRELEKEQDQRKVEMAAKSRDLIAHRNSGGYSHIGERLDEEALSDMAKKDRIREQRAVEREHQIDWMCPKCAFANQHNDDVCKNIVASSNSNVLMENATYEDSRGRARRESIGANGGGCFMDTPEVICGQPKPDQLFRPALLTASSSVANAINLSKERSHRVASIRRQKNQQAMEDEFRQSCPFKPKINEISEEIVRERLENDARGVTTTTTTSSGELRRKDPHLALYNDIKKQQQQREFERTHPSQPKLVAKNRKETSAGFYKIKRMEQQHQVSTAAAAIGAGGAAAGRQAEPGDSPRLRTAIANARPCVRPIDSDASEMAALETRSSSCSSSQFLDQQAGSDEDADLTSRVLAALDELPSSSQLQPASRTMLSRSPSLSALSNGDASSRSVKLLLSQEDSDRVLLRSPESASDPTNA